MTTAKETRSTKRSGNGNNRLMKAKRSFDQAMTDLKDFPKLRDRVGEVREELLQAFLELERGV